MNDKMRKASQLVIGGALCLSLVTGCAKAPEPTPAISQPAATEPSATTKATKPTAAKPAATTKATTAPAESKATEPSATTTATQPPETKPAATTAPTQAPTTAPTAAPTTAPTGAPTTAPTEAPTEATTAPTEAEYAPVPESFLRELEEYGRQYAVSQYGFEVDYSLGFSNSGYYPPPFGYYHADACSNMYSLVRDSVDGCAEEMIARFGNIWWENEDGSIGRTRFNMAVTYDGNYEYSAYSFYG